MSISLRDQFAVAAMQALLSNPSLDILTPQELSHDAYRQADAMLEERDKQAGHLNKIRIAAQNLVNHPKELSVEKSGELILGLLDNYGSQS